MDIKEVRSEYEITLTFSGKELGQLDNEFNRLYDKAAQDNDIHAFLRVWQLKDLLVRSINE